VSCPLPAPVIGFETSPTAVTESLLVRLDFPRRETADLERAGAAIQTMLVEAGLAPTAQAFACRTGRADLGSGFCMLGALGFALVARAGKRWILGPGCAVAIACLAALAGGFDAVLPAERHANLQVTVQPAAPAEQEIVLGAHYDTKTEPLDHVARSGLLLVTMAAIGLAVFCMGTRRRGGRVWSGLAALALAAGSAQLGAGRFLPPSHGILDNGAAAAMLVEMAAEYADMPLRRTRLTFAWWAGEEHGAQGSDAAARLPAGPLPRSVINLEAVGAGPDLGIALYEWNRLRVMRADPRLHRAAMRAGVRHTLAAPVVTDAGSFLARGVAALTLVGLPPGSAVPRRLHSAGDRLPALDRLGVANARATLDRLLRELDAATETSALPLHGGAPAGCAAAIDPLSCPPFVSSELHTPAGEKRCRARPSRSPTIAPAGATKSRS